VLARVCLRQRTGELDFSGLQLAAHAMDLRACPRRPGPPPCEARRELADRVGSAVQCGQIAGQRVQLRFGEQRRVPPPGVVLADDLDLLA
jgi:hypothetical protein